MNFISITIKRVKDLVNIIFLEVIEDKEVLEILVTLLLIEVKV